MKHPAETTCDFCQKPIDSDSKWSTILAVVPSDVAHECHEQWRAMSPSVLGFSAWIPTPTHCNLDMCAECEGRELPNLRAIVAVVVLTALDKRRAKAQQANAEPHFGEY
jgi:hypothetical protein